MKNLIRDYKWTVCTVAVIVLVGVAFCLCENQGGCDIWHNDTIIDSAVTDTVVMENLAENSDTLNNN